MVVTPTTANEGHDTADGEGCIVMERWNGWALGSGGNGDGICTDLLIKLGDMVLGPVLDRHDD